MSPSSSVSGSSGEESCDEDFSVIERLADAIRIEEDVRFSPDERALLVKELYEGPRKCQCCVNWVEECPEHVVVPVFDEPEKEVEVGPPLVIRRRVNRGENSTLVSLDSIEIRHAATRQVLLNVFSMYDGFVGVIRHLVFKAPFHVFFWHWDRFDEAVANEEDPETRKVLVALRAVVKRELAEAFAISKELASNGVISSMFLWTLFAPGSIVYGREGMHDRFYVVDAVQVDPFQTGLNLRFVDWTGCRFGGASKHISMPNFFGTRRITSLAVYPATYLDDLLKVQASLLARGRKFAGLAGMHYKSYRSWSGAKAGSSDQQHEESRIVLDTSEHARRPRTQPLWKRCQHGWGAVLLIDECDLYLEQRSDTSTQRNKLVSRFLTELEYYPSLLFLTTNRERVLDPAVYSRIHLTINYPALDAPSRTKIWTTFLSHGTESSISERELEVLANIDVNGRRIRNIAKTTKIMAKRAGRPICFDDVKKVMRITEGLIIEDPEPEPEYQDARDPFGLDDFH
ncbi:hypothetical protein BN1723_016699 [Verticillium longisporum]|uniref:Uncharacterized protein n=1 Tax=Verticillium longisporum TaxID=100787 RepID=A0A0G4NJR1_VERLO|nr:hypothetical protein BN1723_016699 [Verticillium longisporum]